MHGTGSQRSNAGRGARRGRPALAALVVALALLAGACGGGSGDASAPGGETSVESITLGGYAALPALTRYRVTNKVLAALYKGVSFRDFFGADAPLEALQPRGKYAQFPQWLQTALRDAGPTVAEAEARLAAYDFSAPERERPLALLYELPLSKAYFDLWMAYTLANTRLFSPALELGSVDATDAHDVLARLYEGIRDDLPIREIAYRHFGSEENWRRFRSPEDNTREVMELFLHRFIDAEVPLAAKACQNWYITPEYELVIDFNVNAEPQPILETTVVTCEDFYRAVADHRDLLPTVVGTVVQYVFPEADAHRREAITQRVLSARPETFRDVFRVLLFSRAFIEHGERVKTYEEAFFNLGGRLDWRPSRQFFRYVDGDQAHMNQAPFEYKLGRSPQVPQDTLSFAYFHARIRDNALLDRQYDAANEWDAGWTGSFLEVDYEGRAFLRYLFALLLAREPMAVELEGIEAILADEGHRLDTDWGRERAARVVLDYVSRLPETYAYAPLR